jgi:superfamily II DNA or RNA helicase
MSNKILLSDSCITVQCNRGDAETIEQLSQFYPVHKNRISTEFKLSIHKTPEVLKALRGMEEDNYIFTAAPLKVREYFLRELRGRDRLSELLSDSSLSPATKINDHLTLMPHQQLAFNISKVRDRFCFFYDTRTGKTPMSLAIINDDIQKHPDHKWLILCPLILIENAWIPDAKEFFPNLSVVSCHASTKLKRLKQMEQDANVYVMNIEAFVKFREYFDKKHIHGCFVDESSTMKSHSSSFSKEIVDYAQTLKRFYLLSGTPAPNGEWEYYMQLKAVDFYSVPSSFTQFKERYFSNVSFNPQFEKLVIRYDMKDELYRVIKEHSLYVDKEDVLTTPGRTFHKYLFQLSADKMEKYRKLKNKLYLELGDDVVITAPSTAATLNKLNQFTSGFIIDTQAKKENKYNEEQKQETYLFDTSRFDELENLLRTLGDEQVLIWANYHKEFEVISERLGDKCRCVYGKTSIQEKNEAIRLFKEGKIQYLVANPASADKGLTLTNAHIAIYFSLNYSYELFKQSTERIYGDIRKQPKHCEYYIFIARGTIDAVLYDDVLTGKQDTSTAVLNHLKA